MFSQVDNVYEKTYEEALKVNEKLSNDWLKHKENLEQVKSSVDFFSKKMSHQVMVPLGKHAMIPGKMVHTNEILINIGADYYVKRSGFRAKEVCDRMIKRCDEQLKALENERNLLSSNQSAIFSEDLFGKDGRIDLIEPYDEETEECWKKNHRENMKKHKLEEKKKNCQEFTYEQAMDHLDMLALREELESDCLENNSFSIKNNLRGTVLDPLVKGHYIQGTEKSENLDSSKNPLLTNTSDHRRTFENTTVWKSNKLTKLNFSGLLSNSDEKAEGKSDTAPKRVSFSNSLQSSDDGLFDDDSIPVIYFKHSDSSYNSEKECNNITEITSPSDICRLFATSSRNKPKSILKRTESKNYDEHFLQSQQPANLKKIKHSTGSMAEDEQLNLPILGDIVERDRNISTTNEETSRPVSRFKASRRRNAN